VAKDLWIPVGQVSAIYARENGHGMSFEIEKKTGWEASGQALATRTGRKASDDEPEPPSSPPTGKPSLRVVK
jgi:stringent starvation protein B